MPCVIGGACATAPPLLKVGPSGIYLVEDNTPTSDRGWELQVEALKARGITKGLTGGELLEMLSTDDSNITIVDVRETASYERGTIRGAISVPLFRLITGWTPFKAARRAQFALFGQVTAVGCARARADGLAAGRWQTGGDRRFPVPKFDGKPRLWVPKARTSVP